MEMEKKIQSNIVQFLLIDRIKKVSFGKVRGKVYLMIANVNVREVRVVLTTRLNVQQKFMC